jgi:hypothetical protein
MPQTRLEHAERAEYTLSAQSFAAAPCGLDHGLGRVGKSGGEGDCTLSEALECHRPTCGTQTEVLLRCTHSRYNCI